MSDNDKQLTVAELLARAGKENPGGSERPRRRRRRSLEEGGISVAELTGSFPKVDARPEESRHSSVPIDATADNTKGSSAARSQPDKLAEPAQTQAPAKAEKPVQKGEKVRADDAPAAKSEPAKAKPEPAKSETATKPARADETAVIKQVEQKPEPAKKAGPSAEPAPGGATATATGTAAAAGATAAGAAAKTTKTSRHDVDETGVIPAVEDPTDRTSDDSARRLKGSHSDGRDRDGAAEPDGAAERDDAVEYDGYDEVDEAEDEYDDEYDGGLNIPALVGMILGGLILGVAVFLGFEWMWANLNRILVAVLAIVVTVVMIGVVKAIRTEKDGLMMTIAGIVGVLMTFGPAMVTLL